jgi:hypothetical protein
VGLQGADEWIIQDGVADRENCEMLKLNRFLHRPSHIVECDIELIDVVDSARGIRQVDMLKCLDELHSQLSAIRAKILKYIVHHLDRADDAAICSGDGHLWGEYGADGLVVRVSMDNLKECGD